MVPQQAAVQQQQLNCMFAQATSQNFCCYATRTCGLSAQICHLVCGYVAMACFKHSSQHRFDLNADQVCRSVIAVLQQSLAQTATSTLLWNHSDPIHVSGMIVPMLVAAL